ncbi:hypothetical protein LCGC14_0147610 [marine sediment metagenome]|uniref:Uncharacterized protein n=1 Tax=marine sediment metagenome TaxID=412755 RepID=A0A0F9V3S5_9ZZZZ
MAILTFKVEDSTTVPDPTPIEGVTLSIFEGDEELASFLINSVIGTDVSLPDGIYSLILHKPNYAFSTNVVTLVVAGVDFEQILEGSGLDFTVSSPDENLLTAYVNLVDPSGKAIPFQKILIEIETVPSGTVGGFTSTSGNVIIETDDTGYAETLLPKGASVGVSVVGRKGMYRRLTLPASAGDLRVDLFELFGEAPDYWKPQRSRTFPFEVS